MGSMRQVRFPGNDRVLLENGPEPRPGPGEVIVRVERCALCGSDFKIYHGGHPTAPGHEVAGIVDAPGHALHGRRVAVYIPIFCGACAQCRKGLTHCCETARRLVGWTTPGGYAEALAVPEQCLLPIPGDVPADLAPLVLDTVGTTAHGLRLALRVVQPTEMVVFGAGPIGLGAILVAQSMGIRDIACIEPRAYRAEKAAAFGATVIDPSAARRFELVVEASGNMQARQRALELIAPQGACVFIGESTAPWEIDENIEIKLKDFFLIRSFYFPIADHEPNLKILRDDQERFRSLIDEESGLDGFADMFAAFARGERLKPMLKVGR
jgi:threonine dehydrogenase-like Zn-dependent dehydrogenase